MRRNPNNHRPTAVNRTPLFALIGVICLITLGLLMAFLSSSQTASDNAEDLTRVALEITADYARELQLMLSSTATFTPTPSITPFPTLAPAQWGIRYNLALGSMSPLQETSGNLQFAQPEKIDINFPNLPVPANFYIQSGSQIQFTAVSNSIRLKFLSGDVFINTGQYNSVISEIEFVPGIEFSAGSCMALQFDQRTNEISVWCFEGLCTYQNNFSQQTTIIATGTRVVWIFDPENRQLTPSQSEMISTADAVRYSTFIASADGNVSAQMCINNYMPNPIVISPTVSTPITTPLPTRIANTPIPTRANSTSTPIRAGNTPIPTRANSTATPIRTAIVVPSATSESVTNPIGVIPTSTPTPIPTSIPPSPIPTSIPPSPIPPPTDVPPPYETPTEEIITPEPPYDIPPEVTP